MQASVLEVAPHDVAAGPHGQEPLSLCGLQVVDADRLLSATTVGGLGFVPCYSTL